MEYAYRMHDALIELDPGESKTWRLLPMTSGKIIISSNYAMPPGYSGSSAGSGSSSGSGSGSGGQGGSPRIGHGAHAGGGATAHAGAAGAGTTGVSARSIDRGPGRRGPRGLDDLLLDPDRLDDFGDIGGSFGPTLELTLELIRGTDVVATHINHILHDTPNAGDFWYLRVSRKADGSLGRRRYRIRAQYPSVLPLETRRIPIRFFNRGFARNWNDNPYLDYVRLEGKTLGYRWNRQFAQLYHKPQEDQYIKLPDLITMPEIELSVPRLLAGGDKHPIPDPAGLPQADLPYFALRIDAHCVDSREVAIDYCPDVTLPRDFWFEARFYLSPFGQGTLGFFTEVRSPLLDALDINVTYPSASEGTKTINIRHEVKKALEDHLYQLQFGPDGNSFDKYLRPYLVGRYEVENIVYSHAADPRDHRHQDMVITYVGRQPPRYAGGGGRFDVLGDALERAVDAGLLDVGSLPEHPRLFDVPEEMPQPRQPAPRVADLDVHPGALEKIDRIVVLMMENRSFDQVLGYLSRDGMLPRAGLLGGDDSGGREAPQAHVDGLLAGDNDRDCMRYPEGSAGRDYRSRRRRTSAWPSFTLDNPCHGHQCVERQVSDGMKGFVAEYARRVGNTPEYLQLIMDYLTDAELPAYGALAREFAICDRWFCSHIGGTLPNRFISLTGDLGEDPYGTPQVENPELAGEFAPLEAKTFFDHLTERGVEWKLFEHGYSTLRLFRDYTFDEEHIGDFLDPDRGFAAAARAGALPAVTFIEPDYIEAPGGNDDHAPADMIDGQRLIASIMDALLHSPDGFFEKTLFVITYDEHGGFYDHVPLPFEVETTAADGTVTRRPNAPLATGERRMGVRVPAFVISPLVAPMADGKVNVSHTLYDHTSIPATILRRFCGPRPPLMSPRVEAAADLRDLLTLDTPRPRSDFATLMAEMQQVAGRAPGALLGRNPAAPLRRPAPRDEDDFHGLLAYSSSVAGSGRG